MRIFLVVGPLLVLGNLYMASIHDSSTVFNICAVFWGLITVAEYFAWYIEKPAK